MVLFRVSIGIKSNSTGRHRRRIISEACAAMEEMYTSVSCREYAFYYEHEGDGTPVLGMNGVIRG